MLRLVSISAALILTGCATSTDPENANIYGGPFGNNVTGNEHGVIIGNVWNEMDAFPVAERFCGQYGKAAKHKSTQGYRASFDCV
ncbi:hypothetical protein GCM10011499_22240 [Pelagibacterium lentulum]|uniref:Lipoprotein n=1 Tax=Pelagibacterium lentulum TaxID=2029865 RepID=A0A916VXT2_9HYPH|nr:hypothetical protein GCM10011499_22240 [Pelagibacterium lentulum]